MPFKSYAQEAYLKYNVPSVYKRWKKEFGMKVPNNIKRVSLIKKLKNG